MSKEYTAKEMREYAAEMAGDLIDVLQLSLD